VRHKGKITSWNSDLGFGFVTPAGGGEPVFMHITAIADRSRPPVAGEMVTYDLAIDEKNRPRAVRVRRSIPVRPKSRAASASTSSPIPLIVASLLVLLVVAQRLLRHKSGKRTFQVAFWGTVVMNSIALGWLLTDSGSELFEQLLK